MAKLKRAVVKEELIALTGHHVAALALSQLLYWSERRRDFDEYLKEEGVRVVDAPEGTELTHGWIYKSVSELGDELMISVSSTTLRRHLQALVKKGWVDERPNPKNAWDRTRQYRPNLVKIQVDLFQLGYALADYPLPVELLHGITAIMQSEDSNMQSEDSNLQGGDAIPETTTETTQNTHGVLDDFEREFGPNPRQDEIDAYKPKKIDAAELLLASLGVEVPALVRQALGRMRDKGWYVSDEALERGLAEFYAVTNFAIPTTKATRRLHEEGVRQHLEEEEFKNLFDLYTETWQGVYESVMNGDLKGIASPKSLTSFMWSIVNRHRAEVGGGTEAVVLDRSHVLTRLEQQALVEMREIENTGRYGYFWTAASDYEGQVNEIPEIYGISKS